MRISRTSGFVVIFLSLGVSRSASAHVSLDLQLELVTRQIQTHPFKAELYLRRGELFRARRSFSEALRDYATARRFNPRLEVVDLCRGRLLLEAGRPSEALEPLDRFLRSHASHSQARVTRARALVRLGRRLEAAADYTDAIEAPQPAPRPLPEHYLERAQALAAEGSEYVEEALRGLDEGTRRLGHAVTLELQAADLELALGRSDAALERLRRISGQWARKDPILAREASILERAGRLSEACLVYEEALGALEAIPSPKRRPPAVRRAEDHLRESLERIRVLSSGPDLKTAGAGHR
jgi:tetratricopeptide (TPR) repeat protein